MRVLITGGSGLLGTELKLSLEEDYEIYAWDKKELDITFAQEAIAKIVDLNPDLVIHTAAYTDADACEINIDLAYQINAYGSRNIAVACQESNAEMIYISSDYIFDGKKGKAYCEFDSPNPLNIYGKSKLAGEEFVKSLVNKYFIVRTAWLYGKYGNNFVKTMLRLSTEEDVLTVVNDQIGSPTYTKDLVQAIKELIGSKLYGTYHLTNVGEVSWYQFAKKIFEYSNIEIEVNAVSSQEFIRAATRPKYSALNNYSLKQGLGYQMRDWKVALRDYLHNG
ncbi:dTDP-4-dehydrorhamnose reductase [Orenia marismortui]|uniref:dTDP-4-dehydrorhamnose reductase n=1 Tax=Orenia marismortui TaxID=46469 RepID=UPI000381FE9F|nr:dTDP-4-dehydrorhamnose reductase [Orenia marismortui]